MPDAIQNLSENEVWPASATFGSVTYPPGGTFGPRTQPGVQLVVADTGSIRLSSDGETLHLPPGRLVCQWPGAREHWRFDGRRPTTHRWVQVSFSEAAATPSAVAGWAAAAARHRPESPALRALCAAGLALRGDASAGAAAARLRLAAACLRGFLEEPGGGPTRGGPPPDPARLPPPLQRMLAHVADRTAEPITLTDLAAAACVTPGHLSRLCRERLGTTPVRLLWDARVDRGLELLRATGLSVAEVADQTGFASAFHFSRRVRERTGRPPRELRG